MDAGPCDFYRAATYMMKISGVEGFTPEEIFLALVANPFLVWWLRADRGQMSKLRLLGTIRNTPREKLDLLVNEDDGWFRLRHWVTRDDGASAMVKEIAFAKEELKQLATLADEEIFREQRAGRQDAGAR